MPLGSQAALWAAGLVIATVLSPATQPAARLGSLEREHAQHVLETRPDMAWRYGMREAADRLTPVTQGSMDREALWLRAFRTRLFAVSRTGLAAADRARLDSLHARTEREWLQASPESPLRTDPLAYRMLTDRAVLEVGTTRRVGACERTRRATQRLRAVPEILRAAAINLRAVSVDGPRLAAGVAEAIQSLRTELVSATAECHEPRRRADLVEADSLAIRAFQSFGERLRSSAGDAR